ncbi:MAG TPA: hypothetical protein VFF21_09370 [Flavobacteriaceae bacterium]|nr:hypothetical protein [Flavobacteriaceae bacterium]
METGGCALIIRLMGTIVMGLVAGFYLWEWLQNTKSGSILVFILLWLLAVILIHFLLLLLFRIFGRVMV